MPRALRALADAEEELEHAIGFYELQTTGAGRRFLKAYAQLLSHIAEFPTSGKRISDYKVGRHELRSFVVSTTFPYTVVAAVFAEQVVILAVSHQHQEPGYWADRIAKLER